jgi:hypothetical protein
MIHALSWTEVEEIAAAFEKLNPFDKELIGKSLLEITEPASKDGERISEQITALAISPKRYCLYNRVGQVVEHKESAIGMLMSPVDPAPGDDTSDASKHWHLEAWRVVGRFFDGKDANDYWLNRPSVRRLAISKPHTMTTLAAFNDGKPKIEQLRPFNFIMAATSLDGKTVAVVAPFERDPAKHAAAPWIRTDTAEPLEVPTPRFRTLRSFLDNYAGSFPAEFRLPDGSLPPRRSGVWGPSRVEGKLIRRHITDGKRHLATKEGLEWLDDPAHAFERDPGEIIAVDHQLGTIPTPNRWEITRAAIAAIGYEAVAMALKVAPDTVKDWARGRRRPAVAQLTRMEQIIIVLAEQSGLLWAGAVNPLDPLTNP